MKPIWIELVDKGVANRFDYGDHEIVEINWRMSMYPDLYKKVINHELGHDEGKFGFNDFKHDMTSRTPGLFTFMRNHITAWTQLLPIYWDKRKHTIVYDWSSIVSWVMLFGIAYTVYAIIGFTLYIIRNGIF